MDKTLDRFWGKVDMRGPNDCWEWKAAILHNGYGVFWAFGKHHKAHRFSYEIEHGTIPEPMRVLHQCDNPKCVNPAHLFLGTQADNIADRDRKRRQNAPRGEERPNAILTEAEVIEIRHHYKNDGATYKALSAEYGVHKDTIGRVVRREIWKHI